MFINILNHPVDTAQSRLVRKRVPENNKLKFNDELSRDRNLD